MDRRAPVDPFRTHIESLELAGSMLDRYLQMDNMFPSFLDVTRITSENRIPTVSGQTDIDYPSIDDLPDVKQITTVNKVPLPPEVMEHFGHLQCHCMMGLFTDISRAWLTIDSDIYVWTYERGSDVAFFDGLGETIVNVGLVKPKPGVFNNFVKYLLILTTTIEVVILGVTFSNTQDGHLEGLEEMHLLPDPVFVIPTDGITINTTACTDSGRIFLGGKDGNLYEIVYQAESGWFGKRCKKVNHSKSTLSFLIPSFLSYPFRTEDSIIQITIDNSRHILYTLSQGGVVDVYDLGENGMSMSYVASLSESTMVQTAVHSVQFLDAKIFMSIVQLCAVEANESPYVNFVVVTKSGVRLYYSTSNVVSVTPRPQTVQLLHIRLPPGFTASTLLNRPNNVHKALYRKGTIVLVTTPKGEKGEKNAFWCLSADPYPFRSLLLEMQSVVTLNGTVWALEEVKPNMSDALLACLKYPELHAQQGPIADPPLIVRQHMEPPRKYIVLTSQGVDILIKLRPVDMLRQLLLDNRGPEGKAIKAYFKEQKEDQACATCLILACLDNAQNIQLSEWATRAFFLYGGEPTSSPIKPTSTPMNPAMGATPSHYYSMHGGFNPGSVSTPLAPNQYHAMGQPTSPQMLSSGLHSLQGQSISSPTSNLQHLANSTYQQQHFARSVSQQQQFARQMSQQQPFMSPMQQQQQQQLATSMSPQQFGTPVSQQQQFASPKFQQQHLESSLLPQLDSSVNQLQLESPVYPRLQFESTMSQQQHYSTPVSRQQQFASSIQQQQTPFSPPMSSQSNMDPGVMQPQHHLGFGSQLPPMSYMDMSAGYSAKHNGLYLYLSRILGPIWNLRTVQNTMVDNHGSFLLSVLAREDCVFILGHLHALRSFLEKNPQYSSTVSQGTHLNTNVSTRMMQDGYETPSQSRGRPGVQNTQLEEKQSLDAFKVLVSHICEVMGLWKVLCEHQFHIVAGSLSENHQSELMAATFRSLILAGHELCSLLINCLINSYLNDDASVDAISAKLREICPHLYRNEDAACSKANEMLLSARNIQNAGEKEAKLQTALQLCKSVAPQVNLPLICQWFASSQYYEGILELCSTCALKLDPKNRALHYYKNGQPPGDEEGYRAYVERMQCYKEVTSVLDQLYGQSMSSPYTPSVPSSPGRKAVVEASQSQIAPRESEQQARKLIQEALNSPDDLLHVAIYEWMLGKQLLGELVFLSQPSYETFIKRKAESSSDSTYMFDLLWKYYEKNENHAAASKVLLRLATTSGNKVILNQRVAYLARAVMCMRSDKVGCAPQLGVFLRELEDKIEVARLQMQILDAIARKQENSQTREAITKLNSGLLDITELYEHYAEPFQLWDCKLAIIHCSGHHDPTLIEQVWLNIIESELHNCSSIGANSKMAVVMSKVKALGLEYALSPRCFPITFMVKQLELQCCRLGADCFQVHQTMVALGVSLTKLLQVYDSLISESDLCWFKSGREFHLHEVVGHLADSFLKNPKMVPSSERNFIATKAEDLLTKCSLFLYSKTNAGELVERLQGVKSRLNRLGKEL